MRGEHTGVNIDCNRGVDVIIADTVDKMLLASVSPPQVFRFLQQENLEQGTAADVTSVKQIRNRKRTVLAQRSPDMKTNGDMDMFCIQRQCSSKADFDQYPGDSVLVLANKTHEYDKKG